MLREIHIDKYNKIVSAFKPQIFNSLTVLQTRPYSQSVQHYIVSNQHQELYHLYRTEGQLEPIMADIPFIEKAPKILLFNTEKDHIIIEEQTDQTLYEYLLNCENNYSQYMSLKEEREDLAKRILRNLRASLSNYMEHNIDYNAIHPKNIVRRNMEWELSLVGLVLKNQKESEDYYKATVQKQYQHTYALGTLMFKLLFGFVPFEKKKEFLKFSFKDYPWFLDKEENRKFLKVYSYAEGMVDASSHAKQLIQNALSGNMSLQAFYNSKFFEQQVVGVKKELSPAAREVKMLSLFLQSQQSLILAAIQHRKKHPQQALNSKQIFAQELSKVEVINHLKKHPVLGEMEFDVNFKDEKVKGKIPKSEESVPFINLPYFYREEEFDPQLDLPCRDLIRLIENEKNSGGIHDEQSQQHEYRIKMYTYPYVLVFELGKVSQKQPLDIQKRIYKLNEDLLQISQLNYYPKVKPLHSTHLVIKSFQDIKVSFRELLNEVYKHFLNEAMKKYNVKKDMLSYSERSALKTQGLEYYKLCLKLMQGSVLNRKRGRDLDLQRIETSTVKQVEADLNQLLKQYFPNKIIEQF